MKRLNAWAAVSVVGLVVWGAGAQTPGDLAKQLEELKSRMQRNEAELHSVKSENADLKSRLDAGTNGPSALEVQVNRLQDACAPSCATVLRSAANPITMGGEFRFRRYTTVGDNAFFATKEGFPGVFQEEHDGHYTDARVRLNFRYDFGCDVTAFAEIQSHWAFGDDPTGVWDDFEADSGEGNVHLYQAWFDMRRMFSIEGLSSRLGRQEIVLGNQFQFGNADWYNGVVFDGGRIDWNTRCFSAALLMLKLASRDGDVDQIASFDVSHDDDELYGIYATVKSIRNVTIDLYWLYVNGHGGASGENSQNSGANGFLFNPNLGNSRSLYPGEEAYFHTFGARVAGCLNLFCGLDYNLEGAYQTGDLHNLDADGSDRDIAAFTVEGEVGVTFDKSSRFRVFARALFAEGPDEDDDVGYLILYPNRHSNHAFRARYGLADLIPMTNVFTAQVGLHFDPFCNWTFGATGLWATTDEPVGTGLSDDYGYEIDVWGEWRWSQQVTFAGGVAFVVPDDQGEIGWGFPEGDVQVVAYLQARLWF